MNRYTITAEVNITLDAFNASDAQEAVKEALLEAESLGATVELHIKNVRELE